MDSLSERASLSGCQAGISTEEQLQNDMLEIRHYKKYSGHQLNLAVKAVLDKTMSTNGAAFYFGIPCRTLWRHVSQAKRYKIPSEGREHL